MTPAHMDDNGASEQYEPDYSWIDLPHVRPDDNALSSRGVVAGVCGGIAFGILLIAVVL